MQTISVGNKVRHLTDPKYNNNDMVVEDVNGNKILCGYYDKDNNYLTKEFNLDEIQYLNDGLDNGFL